jgi:hypothetical protein
VKVVDCWGERCARRHDHVFPNGGQTQGG